MQEDGEAVVNLPNKSAFPAGEDADDELVPNLHSFLHVVFLLRVGLATDCRVEMIGSVAMLAESVILVDISREHTLNFVVLSLN